MHQTMYIRISKEFVSFFTVSVIDFPNDMRCWRAVKNTDYVARLYVWHRETKFPIQSVEEPSSAYS